MPGMSSGLNVNNPTIVAAFKHALLRQGLIALLILALIAIVWQALHFVEARRAISGGAAGAPASPTFAFPEAPARRLLRVAFGCIWILDGLLQAQPDMPLGMTTSVMKPAAASSPTWVQHVVNAGATVWAYHPIE